MEWWAESFVLEVIRRICSKTRKSCALFSAEKWTRQDHDARKEKRGFISQETTCIFTSLRATKAGILIAWFFRALCSRKPFIPGKWNARILTRNGYWLTVDVSIQLWMAGNFHHIYKVQRSYIYIHIQGPYRKLWQWYSEIELIVAANGGKLKRRRK